MKVRIAAASVLVLLGGTTLVAASWDTPADTDGQEVVVEISLENGRLVADPDPVPVHRGQQVSWNNTLGGDVAIYFHSPAVFGTGSLRGQQAGQGGLRGRRQGNNNGRAVGNVPDNAPAGSYKYDIEAYDLQGNVHTVDPELDCC